MWGEEEKVQKFLKCFQPLETLFFFKLKSLSTVLERTLHHGIKTYAWSPGSTQAARSRQSGSSPLLHTWPLEDTQDTRPNQVNGHRKGKSVVLT